MTTPPGSGPSRPTLGARDHTPAHPSHLRQSFTISSPPTTPEEVGGDGGSGLLTAPPPPDDTASSPEASPKTRPLIILEGPEGMSAAEDEDEDDPDFEHMPLAGPSNAVVASSSSRFTPIIQHYHQSAPPSHAPHAQHPDAHSHALDGPSALESTPLLVRGPNYTYLEESDPAHPGPCMHGSFSPRPSSPIHTDHDEGASAYYEESVRGDSVGTIPTIDSTMGGGEDFIGGMRNRGSTGSEAGLGERLGGEGSRSRSIGFGDGEGTGDGGAGKMSFGKRPKGWKRRWVATRMQSKKMSTSSALAQRAGVTDTTTMYLSYYIPSLQWMSQLEWRKLHSDLIAALTVASFYLPMALSLADNLAHVPPIHGLYAFVFNPLVYALLGSCPQMVVGPEAAGSLLVGTVVKSAVDKGHGSDDDAEMHARICGIVTGMAGAIVLSAGLARLGFLDSVLSRPFLRGFISAVGFVIAVDQLIPELGLGQLAEATPGVGHGSSMDKLRFLVNNLGNAHGLTCAVAGVSFTVIMVFRELKRRLQPRYPSAAYVPDRFLVVVFSAFLAWRFSWDKKGVEVLGTVESASGHLFTFRWPFQMSHMPHIRDALGTSFLIALLGFFESSVAAKSLGDPNSVQGMQLSANRELVALGTANLVGACFMSLPAFGGYGRSKVNKATGGRSPMSSIFLSIITLFCIVFLLPYFYYLPKPVLCSMITVVAWSLIEECPADILFFIKIRGWTELGLMLIIFVATIFYSLTLGIAIGVGLSLLQVIRHSTRPRIQILGRVPGTTNRFENAEDSPEDRLEFIEGCLIVKIPEPLTFANTGELKNRLRRLELYGTAKAHPALPRLRREDSNRNIIFDVHGVTFMDGSGTQVLEEIVRGYAERGVRVFFSRVPSNRDSEVWRLMRASGIVELAGGEGHFCDDVQEALKMTEAEDLVAGLRHQSQTEAGGGGVNHSPHDLPAASTSRSASGDAGRVV